MGCKESSVKPVQDAPMGNSSAKPAVEQKTEEIVFGNGVHVGRAGNVDLTGRKMDFLGTNIVDMINNDELHRTATSLTLSNNILYTLGREVLLLSSLEEIDMESNRFTRIPEVLTQLENLWRLNLSNNPIDSLHGADCAPRMQALRSLSLRDCSLTQFPSRLLDCAQLEELDLSNNPALEVHDKNIVKLGSLKKLKVANCGLSGKKLPACIRRTATLVSLDISNNKFSFFEDPSIEFFGKSLPKSLEELQLRGMNLLSVPPVVVTLKKLTVLDMACNPVETLDVLAGRFVKRIPRTWSGNGVDAKTPPEVRANPSVTFSPTTTQAEPAVVDPTRPPAGEGQPLGQESGFNSATAIATGAISDDGATSVKSEGGVSTNSRVSLSKISKVGMIASVSNPIMLKKLSLRACGLRTVPKYFHKMTNLEELDLSENDQLDDPNMTLFSLQNLKVLNVIGCPFAEDPSKSRNEWFDIAKLRKLTDLQWELWMGNHNMSPYRTKIPIEICGLKLNSINQVALRRSLFVGDTVETVINLLHDGYFKVDLAVDEGNVHSHIDALNAFAAGESFFFPSDVVPRNSPDAAPIVHADELAGVHMRIAINRYIFFLAMQAANYDAVIIPPLDVMIIHYAQITCSPVKYRMDCEAICGRILNCNYRAFFFEQARYPQAAKDAIAASKKIWNLMVRSAQTELAWLRYDFWDKRARSLAVSSSAFALAKPGGAHSPVGAAGHPKPQRMTTSYVGSASSFAEPLTRTQSLPCSPLGQTADEMFADFTELRKIDSTHDLCGVLDQAITSHFLEQGEESIVSSLTEFYKYTNCFLRHEDSLLRLTLDWTRYVKFLALYAFRVAMSYQSDTTLVMEPMADSEGNLYTPAGANRRTSSVLGKHYDELNNVSFANADKYLPLPSQQATKRNSDGSCAPESTPSQLARRTTSGLGNVTRSASRLRDASRRSLIRGLKVDPIPTIGITLLLHAHRMSHVKYFQTLSLLGIEDIDVRWEETDTVIAETSKAWAGVYEEEYIGSRDFTFLCKDNIILPVSHHVAVNAQTPSQPATTPTVDRPPLLQPVSEYSASARPRQSIVAKRTAARTGAADRPSSKKVVLCGGDTEYGVL